MPSSDAPKTPAPSNAPALTLYAISILIALFLVRGFILASIMPPFEAWDEYQHLGFIDHCSTSSSPVVYQEATLDPTFLRAVAHFPRAEGAPLAAYGAATYSQYWTMGTPPPSDNLTPIALYEAQQPPLYYRLMAPVYRLTGGRENLRLTVSILRLINVAFGAITLAITLLWIRQNIPGSIALIMACWVAFHPLVLLNVTRVANDALACLLGTAVVVILLSKHKTHFARQSILLAILLPLAATAKSTNLTLIPLTAAALLVAVLRREISPVRALLSSVLILTFGTAITWPYFSANLHHFGVLTPMQESIINHQAHKSLIDVLTAMPLIAWAKTTVAMWVTQGLWTGGWSFLRTPSLLKMIYVVILFLSAAFLIIGIFTPRRRVRLPIDLPRLGLILFFLASVEAGLMYHAAESYGAWAGVITTNPWYASLAIPWWMIALGAGAFTASPRGPRLFLLWSMPILCFTAECYGLIAKMIPFYSATSFSMESLRRLATLHPAGMGLAAILISGIIGSALLITLIAIAASQNPNPPAKIPAPPPAV